MRASAVLGRLGSALQNAFELGRLGATPVPGASPYAVFLDEPVFRLRRYFPERAGEARPAVLLVPPLMLTADVYDVAPDGSTVALLADDGIDPWVVDFGAPEREKGGLERTLSDHVLAVSRAVEHVRQETGRAIHLAGYSQGGMFCYQTAAYRRCVDVASVVTFGSPVDVHKGLPPGVPDDLAVRLLATIGQVAAQVAERAPIPAWVSRTSFRLLSPAKELRQQLEFLTGLYDRSRIQRRAAQRRFLAGEGWVSYPGPALRDLLDEFLVHNRMLRGGFVIDDRTVTLADITCPVLAFVGSIDEIARPPAVRAIREAAPRADVYEYVLEAGHFGLVVGSRSIESTWPTLVAWARWHEGIGKSPEGVHLLGDSESPPAASAAARLGQEIFQATTGYLSERFSRAGGLAASAIRQVPRLARLGSIRRDTRIGLGLLLEEQASWAPEDTFFLFEGRAYSYADANHRVDAVVRGLVSLGIRQGDRVGILMRTRPSALALLAALNRLGAVAVLLRPNGDFRQEIRLARIEHVVADPEHAAAVQQVLRRSVFVLGGGGGARSLPRGQIDMEAIDPEPVRLPDGYQPNPGRAAEIAMILFSGHGDAIRTNRITNQRWILSAYGTASAATLSSRDTVYVGTPLQHPAALLVAVGGALAGGSRLAVATHFDAATFWQETRRYGVSIVAYTGTMLRTLVDAPPDKAERHHPIRLFVGSGMPRPIWHRLVDRFAPVGVLEFYASTEGTAVLGNLSGKKIGSVGRPLPGSAEVEIAAWDVGQRELVRDASGLCRPAEAHEPGMLLARVDPERGGVDERPLPGVFEPDDAWTVTGDLFQRDEDGDSWIVDHEADVIHTSRGPLFSVPIEEALGGIDSVSLAVVYGERPPGSRHEVPAAALVLRKHRSMSPETLTREMLRRLEPEERPVTVRIVERIPMTIGHRPLKHRVRSNPPAGMQVFRLDRKTSEYVPVGTD